MHNTPQIGLLPPGPRPEPLAHVIIGETAQTLSGAFNDWLRSKWQSPQTTPDFPPSSLDQPRPTGFDLSDSTITVLTVAAFVGVALLFVKRA